MLFFPIFTTQWEMKKIFVWYCREADRELGDLGLSAGLTLCRHMTLGKSFNLFGLFPTYEMRDLNLLRYFSFLKFYDSKNRYLQYILNLANG